MQNLHRDGIPMGKRWRGLRARLVAKDVDDEIAFHLRERTDALIARGWEPEPALAEARRRFGEESEARPALIDAAMRRERHLALLERLDALRLDLRLAARGLRRAPLFALGTALAFALGIGTNATMFSVLDRLLLRPPPGVATPENVYTLRPVSHDAISYPEFVALRHAVRPIAAVSASLAPPLPFTRAEAGPVHLTFVDADYFRMLGARVALGRAISEADTQLPDGSPVAVLGFGFWQRTFGGDPSVVGQTITLGAERIRIIGVAEQGFNGVDTRPCNIWLPLPLAGRLTFIGPRWQTTESSWLRVVARLAPGASPRLLADRATALHRARQSAFANRDTAGMVIRSILPSRAEHLSPEARVASLLGVVSLAVFILACTNAITLMLARAFRRRREVAVRMAIGVSRKRLAVQCLIEAVCLSAFGGCIAFAVAAAGSAFMRGFLLQGFAWDGPLVDARTSIYIGCATLVAGTLSGAASAFVLLRRFDVSSALSQGRTGSGYRHRAISMLVAVQAALAATLAVGGLLFGNSLMRIRVTPLGMDVPHVVVVAPDARAVNASSANADAMFAEFRAQVSRVPTVRSVAVTQGLPYAWYIASPLSVPGDASIPERARRPWVSAVTPEYFATIGTHIVAGRAFVDADDRATSEGVAIVGLTLAKALWPTTSAIGRCVRLGADSMPCLHVIGVAEDIRESPLERSDALDTRVYVPLSQRPAAYGSRALIARVSGDPAMAIHAIRSAIDPSSASVAAPDIWPMQTRLDPELRPWQLGAAIFGAFSVLALGLAVLGVYSVIAYGVAQRTHEMGVRIALGARRRHILSLVGSDGVRLVGAGLLAGLVSAALLAPLVQPLLFETSARSVTTYALVTFLMITAGIAASIIPAMRASRTDPMSAMRTD